VSEKHPSNASQSNNKSSYEGLKKAELEILLDEYMRAHRERLSKEERYSPYYKRVDSPTKRDSSTSVALVETKTPKRRITKAKEEIEV
jgi:hypothetical protein